MSCSVIDGLVLMTLGVFRDVSSSLQAAYITGLLYLLTSAVLYD